MSWAVGWDSNWNRWIGYGVPAYCDHPECNEEINRGLSYVCGGEPFGGEHGCGLYFCGKHQCGGHQNCARCARSHAAFSPKPEHPEWMRHVLTDESWSKWRAENPDTVAAWTAAVAAQRGGA